LNSIVKPGAYYDSHYCAEPASPALIETILASTLFLKKQASGEQDEPYQLPEKFANTNIITIGDFFKEQGPQGCFAQFTKRIFIL
jgi:hypothetical protein